MKSIHDVTIQQWNGLILLAFVFARRCDPIFYSIGAEHYGAEEEEEKAETPASGCESGQQHENPDRNRSGHPQKTCEFMSFVDVSQAGNDTQDNRYCVTRLALGSFRRAALPIASITALRALRQQMSTIWTRHFVSGVRLWLGGGRVGVFHAHFNN